MGTPVSASPYNRDWSKVKEEKEEEDLSPVSDLDEIYSVAYVEEMFSTKEELDKMFRSKISFLIHAYNHSRDLKVVNLAHKEIDGFVQRHPEYKGAVGEELKKKGFEWGMAICTIQ